MIVPVGLDRLPALLGELAARWSCWSPVGKRVEIVIDDAADERLLDIRLTGTVRAVGLGNVAQPLLIHLEQTLRHERARACEYADLVVARPALRGHGPSRLLVTWAAVRVIDAPSFADDFYSRTIGVGRMTLI